MNFTIITPTREQMLAHGWQAFIPENERIKLGNTRTMNRKDCENQTGFMLMLEIAVREHFKLDYIPFTEVIAKIESLNQERPF